MSGFKKNVGYTFSGQFLKLILGTLTTGFLARGLGPELRGLYALAIWIPATFSIFSMLGQAEVNSVFAGLHKERRSRLCGHSLWLSIILGGMSSLIILFIWMTKPFPLGQFASLPFSAILSAALLLPLLMIERLWGDLARGIQRIGQSVSCDVGVTFVQMILTLGLVLWLQMGITAALLIVVGGRILSVLGLLYILRDYARHLNEGWNFHEIRESLSLGVIFTISSSAMYLINQGVVLVLGYSSASKSDIGLYAVAAMLGQQMQMIPTSVSSAFLPHMSNNPEQSLHQVPRVFRITSIICVLAMLAMIALSGAAVWILMGRQYLSSVPALIAMLPGLTVFGATRVLGSYLWVIKKPQYGMVYNWIAFAILILSSVILLRIWGIIGAALANSCAYGVLSLSTAWAYCRESKTPWQELIPAKADIKYLWDKGTNAAHTIISRSNLLLSITQSIKSRRSTL